MFAPSLWQIILGFIIWPFYMVFIYPFKKIYEMWTYTQEHDVELLNNLYEIMEEARDFVLFLGKGPVKLERFRTKNVLYETHIELKYLSSEFKKQRRIAFFVKKKEKRFSYYTGGNSAGGGPSYDKEKINFDKLAEDIFRTIEISSLDKTLDWNQWNEWRETLTQILANYHLKNEFIHIRKALIVLTNDKSSEKHHEAFNYLSHLFGNNQKTAQNFINDIDGAYASLSVLLKLN